MTSQQLLEPIIEGGILSTNFFNGRRLTAEDLLRKKKSNREHERLLGQAIGEGVVHGLEVGLPDGLITGGSKIEIQKGLAINRKGDVLYLPNKIPVPLVPPVEEQNIQASFVNCEKLATQYLTTNHGVYVLLIAPASGLSGSAAMSSIPDDGSIIGCGKSDSVEGVQFRLVKMDLDGPAFKGLKAETKAKLDEISNKTDMASVSMFRNIVAHACFGTEEKEKFIVDPFGSNDFSSYGAIDKLRSLDDESPYKVTDCDLPLAIIRWTEKHIGFVDMWSARRRPYELSSSVKWSTFSSQRSLTEAEAMFSQFQEHIAGMINGSAQEIQLSQVEVRKHFRHLPAAGVIPFSSKKAPGGFDYQTFFKNLTCRGPAFIDGARTEALLRSSLAYTAIDLNEKELIWLYMVRQNMETNKGNISNQSQSYMIFSSGHMPYQANARYEVARWDYSNYAKI